LVLERFSKQGAIAAAKRYGKISWEKGRNQMAKKEEVKKWMQVIVDKLNEVGPITAEGWGGSLQFVISDLKTGWLVKMAMDGTVESWDEKIDEEAALGVLEMDSDTFVGIINKTLNPLEAQAEHKIIVRKSMEALMKVLPATM
jgi:putative sterol carrier protein